MEKFIKNLAKGAGKILLDGFGKKMRVGTKTAYWDVVTKFDFLAEEYITKNILNKYPNHGIIGEENGHVKKSKKFWVIDPIDGTHAFVKGIPQFSVSIAFVDNNILKTAAIYDPVHDELYTAQKNRGAKLNGKKINCSERTDLWTAQGSVIFDTGKSLDRDRTKAYKLVVAERIWLSKLDSFALTGCYVSVGRYDFSLTTGLSPWDMAAAGLIAGESGAKVTAYDGKPYRWDSPSMIAANATLHKKIFKHLHKK